MIKCSKETFSNFLSDWNKVYNSFFFNFIVYSLTIALTIYVVMTFNLNTKHQCKWYFKNWLFYISASNMLQISIFPIFMYLIISFIARITLGCMMLKSFFKRIKVRIQIIHYDGCGGLGAIGELTFLLSVILFIVGIIIVAALIGFKLQYGLSPYNPINFLVVLAFVLTAYFIIFSPMRAAHEQMVESKNRLLFSLNKVFENEYKHIKDNIQNIQKINIREAKEMLALRDIYQVTKTHPSWPFNTKVVYTFIVSIFIPLCFVLVQSFLPLFVNWIKSLILNGA